MLATMLQACDVRTGAFTSPHLSKYNERITIDGTDINDAEWEQAFNPVWRIASAMMRGELAGYSLGRPALFEVLFAIAALHFREREVQWAAIETGMGGRLDATNTLCPDVAVVTNISLEHTQVLGTTVRQIAAEKAAIVKPGIAVVTGARDSEAVEVIEEAAAGQGAYLVRLDRDFSFEVKSEDARSQFVDFRILEERVEMVLAFGGRFQAENAAVALAAGVVLRSRDTALHWDRMLQGLRETRIPGRFETVSSRPRIILDGAHNPAAAFALAQALRATLEARGVILVFAAMADKDVEAMAASLAPLARVVIVTRAPNTERAALPATLCEIFKRHVHDVIPEEDAECALELASGLCRPDETVVVTGSLYLVGFMREALLREGVRS
jgi:dihydrofolate synthase / folylpolyglutamate synthase